MRIKEALFFNVVSSILSLFGMLVGIAVGNVESASYWIFAVTAGTFMYIALVDMVSTPKEGCRQSVFCLFVHLCLNDR